MKGKDKKSLKDTDKKPSRRDFVKWTLASGTMVALGSSGFMPEAKGNTCNTEEKVRLLNSDGKLVEALPNDLSPVQGDNDFYKERARKGIPGRNWVMVIDLARCKHALKCQEACNKAHYVPGDRQWINVHKMQDAESTAPYWMPKPCFHCERPPCVSVCPVDATYKRSDGIVLIDNERCIGCRFCMVACPYSVRVFNWGQPDNPEEIKDHACNPETGLPRKMGTVEKCDFCPDMLRKNKLPHCVTACPNGVFFMGDRNEDTVTNGSETFRFSELMAEKAGYRYMEDLGTEPNVYYLPPKDRMVPFEETIEGDKNQDSNHH